MRKKLKLVLLVDDNESDNFLNKRILEKSGFTEHIVAVADGKEALDFIIDCGICREPDKCYCQPDLIFLDINMPVMNAWDFLEEYYKLEEVQKAKTIIILLTTSLNPADMTKAEMLIGSNRFQNKPLTLISINEIIQMHFPEYL
jgi:CheY-like chemotaxis protein